MTYFFQKSFIYYVSVTYVPRATLTRVTEFHLWIALAKRQVGIAIYNHNYRLSTIVCRAAEILPEITHPRF